MRETKETWVRSLGREDPLEEDMATHSSVLGWEIPWTEEPGGQQTVHGVTQSQTRLRTHVPRGLKTPRFNGLIRFSSGEDVILLEKVRLERVMNEQKPVCARDMLIIEWASKDRENMYYPIPL